MIGMNCLRSDTDAGKSISKIPTPVSAAWTYTSESMRRASSFRLSALRNRSSGGEKGVVLRDPVAAPPPRGFLLPLGALPRKGPDMFVRGGEGLVAGAHR